MLDFLSSLNPEQLQAVRTTEGYVRVVAGAGSGKTRVLTSRYVYLSKYLGIAPDRIMSVTFTNKAAREMKQRIQTHMPDESGGWILTFHGAAHKILQQDIHYLVYPDNFMIMDEDDQEKLLSKIYTENDLSVKNFTYKRCLDAISVYKCITTGTSYVKYITDPTLGAEPPELELSDRKDLNFIINAYMLEQRKNYYLDFDDLLFYAIYLLKTNDEARAKWQERFEYIQVDEFQDVSAPEFEFVQLLSGKHNNLFIVGDPDQTIYSWRGANINFFLDFDKYYPKTKTIIMNKNYRSTPEILAVANSLIKHNKNRIDKSLVSVVPSGVKVSYHHSKSVEQESKFIAEKILELQARGAAPSDIAVLYRGNYMTRSLEEIFVRKGIKYRIYNGIEFYRRQEIKDALAYLRMVVFADDVSFLRVVNVPARGIGKKRLAKITVYAKENNINLYAALKVLLHEELFVSTEAKKFVAAIEEAKGKGQINVNDLLDLLMKRSGYEEYLMLSGDRDRINNINELKNSVKQYIDSAGETVTLEEYLNAVSLMSNADSADSGDAVKLMTIHTSKGLEFPYVFVCCLNEGKFPSGKIKNLDDMEEERRVAYVAFTRAEKELFLSDAEGYNAQSDMQMYTSRFVFNVSEGLLNITGEISSEFVKASKSFIARDEGVSEANRRASGFSAGEAVEHEAFGRGKILSVEPDVIRVEFESGVVRSFGLTYSDVLKKIK